MAEILGNQAEDARQCTSLCNAIRYRWPRRSPRSSEKADQWKGQISGISTSAVTAVNSAQWQTDTQVVAGLIAARAHDHQVGLIADRRGEAERRATATLMMNGVGLRPLTAATRIESGIISDATATLVMVSVSTIDVT